jgi:hypothetical protein
MMMNAKEGQGKGEKQRQPLQPMVALTGLNTSQAGADIDPLIPDLDNWIQSGNKEKRRRILRPTSHTPLCTPSRSLFLRRSSRTFQKNKKKRARENGQNKRHFLTKSISPFFFFSSFLPLTHSLTHSPTHSHSLSFTPPSLTHTHHERKSYKLYTLVALLILFLIHTQHPLVLFRSN